MLVGDIQYLGRTYSKNYKMLLYVLPPGALKGNGEARRVSPLLSTRRGHNLHHKTSR